MNLYERYGKKTEQLEQAIEDHYQTLALLRAIKNGEVDISNVVIEGNGWRVENASHLSPTKEKE